MIPYLIEQRVSAHAPVAINCLIDQFPTLATEYI